MNRNIFSILIQSILEICFNQEELKQLEVKPIYQVYGYNEASTSPNSIRGKILAKNGNINGRKLSELIAKYHEGSTEIEVPKNLLEVFFTILDVEDINEFEKIYLNSKRMKNYNAPKKLKYLPFKIKKKEKSTDIVEQKLENLANSYFWFYTHNSSSTEYLRTHSTGIVRRLLRIKSKNASGDYLVELENKPPYLTFTGRLRKNYSGGNILVFELETKSKSVKKKAYVIIHVDLDASKSCYLGGFTRYSDNASIFTGSVVIEKITNQELIQELNNDFTKQKLGYIPFLSEEIKPYIKKYLTNKYLNQVKIPRGIYTEEDFMKWSQKQAIKNNEHNLVYDLFVTSPVRGLYNKLNQFNSMKADIVNILEKNNLIENKSIKEDLISSLEKHFLGKKENTFTVLTDLQEEVIKMIGVLKTKTRLKNIYYPPLNENYSPNNRIDSSTWLSRQLTYLKQSKGFLLIYNETVVSSSLIQLGWAMLHKNIPIFILHKKNSRKDLPFLVQKADTLKNYNINITSLEEIGGIQNIPEWIKDNEYDKYILP